MFVKYQGKTKYMWYNVTISTAFSKGALVYMDTSVGTIKPTTSSIAGSVTLGVIRHAIASTDADFATARMVEVEVPVEKNVVWKADVTSGLAATDVGKYLDLTNSLTMNYTGSTYMICFVVKYLSTTKALVILNIGPECTNVIGD